MRCEFFCIEDPLRRFFYAYGKLVGRRPRPFILVPLAMTVICSTGLLRASTETSAPYLFTPTDAPSKTEKKIIDTLFPLRDGNFEPDKATSDIGRSVLIVSAADDGDILRLDYAGAVEELNRYVVQRISIKADGKEYTFGDLCMKGPSGRCFDNGGVRLVNALRKFNSENLTFPTFLYDSRPVYIASALGGVVQRTESRVIKSAKAWFLVYQLQFEPPERAHLTALWEKEFQSAMEDYSDTRLRLAYFHSHSLDEELAKKGEQNIPRFAVTFVVLIAFATLCNTSLLPSGTPYIDWAVSKPLLAVGGIVSAAMGVLSASGFLSLCGYVTIDIVGALPVLVVSICAEYMFLLTGAWKRTNRLKAVSERLGEALSVHGVSILLAMLTGAMAFAVGTITSFPAIQIFCIHACVAMTVAMFYEFTFFIGLLALFGHMEERHDHCLLCRPTISMEHAGDVGTVRRFWMLGSSADPEAGNSHRNYSTTFMDRFFECRYAAFLMRPRTEILVAVLFIAYLAVAIYGCANLRVGLQIEKLMQGSYAATYYSAWERYFAPYGVQIEVVVQNAKKVSSVGGQTEALQIVSDFANTLHTIGNESVGFFLIDLDRYLKSLGYAQVVRENPSLFRRALHDFLSVSGFDHWRHDLIFGDPRKGEDPDELTAYRFTVGLRDFATSEEQVETMLLMREVAARYPKHEILAYMLVWPFADQYRLVLPNTLKNIGIALALMVVTSIVLIPHPLCSLCVALAIVSIDTGVIGYMALWDVRLDTVSMITIIMSVGFSVDFTAHISYGYLALSREGDSVKRMAVVLGARCWPCIQACLATILGITALLGTNAYSEIFFKTVFLIMVIGLVHALVFLPVMLNVLFEPVFRVATNQRDS